MIEWEFNQDLQSIEAVFIDRMTGETAIIEFPGLEAKDHLEALKCILNGHRI